MILNRPSPKAPAFAAVPLWNTYPIGLLRKQTPCLDTCFPNTESKGIWKTCSLVQHMAVFFSKSLLKASSFPFWFFQLALLGHIVMSAVCLRKYGNAGRRTGSNETMCSIVMCAILPQGAPYVFCRLEIRFEFLRETWEGRTGYLSKYSCSFFSIRSAAVLFELPYADRNLSIHIVLHLFLRIARKPRVGLRANNCGNPGGAGSLDRLAVQELSPPYLCCHIGSREGPPDGEQLRPQRDPQGAFYQPIN